MSSVLAISSTEAWIVGGHRPGGLGTLQPLSWRWRGSGWRFLTTPDVGPFAVLTDVAPAAGGGLWAVGWEVDQVAAHAVAMQLTGRSWAVVNAPAIFHGVPS